MDLIRIVEGDITRLKVDAIVNAANEHLLGGGGVDGAIHRAAGSELREACEGIEQWRPGIRCPAGEARITPGYQLPAKWVIHTVGPVWHGGEYGESNVLSNCYRNCLQLAVEHDVRTIAFPAISCGVFGYPADRAARVAYREITCFTMVDDFFDEIVLVAFDKPMCEILESAASGVEA